MLHTSVPAGIARGIEVEMFLAVEMTASRSHTKCHITSAGTQMPP